MIRRDGRVQILCHCKAYRFPHRMGGGACNPADWAQTYRTMNGSMCECCNCDRRDGTCDVIEGIEKIDYCEGYREAQHTGEDIPQDYWIMI